MLPKISRLDLIKIALPIWEREHPGQSLPKVFFVMWRAYWLRTMGDPTRNDVGINDDAGWLVTPDGFYPQRLNTDPSKLNWNPAVGKPYGMLKGNRVWWFYPGAHKGHRPSFRQADDAQVAKKLGIPHNGKFLVTRMWGWDDPRNYEEWGHFQANIHRQLGSGTSSWMCLTIPQPQSDQWLGIATAEIKKHGQKIIANILIDPTAA